MKSLTESFEKTFIREARWKLIVRGLWITIAISVMSVLLGTVLALPLCMACRSRKKWMSGLGNGYISVIMGTPILVILMILYYVVFAKVDIKAEIVAILAFALDFAAYISVAFQSGIDSVPKGQWEAAMALGHNKSQTFFRFIVPQAVRIVLPVYRSEIVSILKATSVVGYIAIEDLTKMSDIIRSRTYEAFFPLISTAIIYFLVAQLLIIAIKKVEFRLNPDNHRNKLLQRRVE